MMKSFFFKSKSTYKNDELLFFFHGLSEPYPTDSLIKKCVFIMLRQFKCIIKAVLCVGKYLKMFSRGRLPLGKPIFSEIAYFFASFPDPRHEQF